MKTSNDELKNVLLTAIQNSNREFNSHIDHMVQKMREQTVTLDTALTKPAHHFAGKPW